MVNPRAKGAKGEESVRNLLRLRTKFDFQRTPGSGSGKIKGDLHIPTLDNRFCIEVKNYADSPITDKIFTSKTSNLNVWWTKLRTQAAQCKQEPLLFFKYNRSKIFVVTGTKPVAAKNFLYFSTLDCYIMLSEDWLENEQIDWIK